MRNRLSGLVVLVVVASSIVQAQDPSAPVFDQGRLHQVRLTMSASDWEAVRQWAYEPEGTPAPEVPAAFQWGADAPVTGCRVKPGGFGSRSYDKPRLNVKFPSGNRWRGLKGIVLRNLTQDPSMMHERIGFGIADELGIPHPRLAHTRMDVNGQYVGLYYLYEKVENPFLQRVWGETGGALYKVAGTRLEYAGEDPASYVPFPFDPEEGTSNHAPLIRMIERVNNAPADRWEAEVSPHVDLEEWLRVLAHEATTGEYDGFAGEWTINNTYFYRARDGRFRLTLWDRELCYDETAIGRSIFSYFAENAFTRGFWQVPSLRARYLTLVGDSISRFSLGRYLSPRVDGIYAQIRQAAYEDTNKPYSNDAFEAGAQFLRDFGIMRRYSVLAQIGGAVEERELAVGLGRGGEGRMHVYRTAEGAPPEPRSRQLPWSAYDAAIGEAHPAYGDIDGDGLDECVVGMGRYPAEGGYVLVFDDAQHGGALLRWLRVPWSAYNAANGATWPACGDLDGDARAEIVVGLGAGGQGTFYVFDDATDGFGVVGSAQLPWAAYNQNPSGGETRVSCGDVDGDGLAEVVVGLGAGGQGRWAVFEDLWQGFAFGRWNTIEWSEYVTSGAGTTRPACGDVDGDGLAEVVMGLEGGSRGRMPYIDDAAAGYRTVQWIEAGEEPYRTTVGHTRPALGDTDNDGDADLAVGFASSGLGKVQVFRRSTTQGQFVHRFFRQVAVPSGYAAANGETWPAIGHERWSR